MIRMRRICSLNLRNAKKKLFETPHEKEKVAEKKITLLNLVKDRAESDLYIVNTRKDLTNVIKATFEKHNCQVRVSVLEQDLATLYIMLHRKVSIKKLRKLIEKGKKFGIHFCITKTGMTTILLSKIKQIFAA